MKSALARSLPALLGLVVAASVSRAEPPKLQTLFASGPHTGPVEQAVVGVTTRFADRHGQIVETRHGSGIMLRCDGFVLFSAAMLDHRTDEPDDIRPTIFVTVSPGSPDEKTVEAPWPRSVPSDVPLRVVKLSAVHVPALKTLAPGALKPGAQLTLSWTAWNDSTRHFGSAEKRALGLAPTPPGRQPPLRLWMDRSPDGAPSGAVVLDSEGLALGMAAVQAGEDSRSFVSVGALERLTNCVAPLPTTDPEFADSQKRDGADGGAGGPADGAQETQPPDDGARAAPADGAAPALGAMVRIPGGPVRLPRAILDTQIEMEKAQIACVPSFQIDRFAVTNQEYWDFWAHLPDRTGAEQAFQRLAWPAGWAESATPFPEQIAKLPVVGVALAGAQAYARAHGKRLPTPYEWTLAALGPNGDAKTPDWLAQYIADTNSAAVKIKQTHLAFLKQAPEIHGDDFLLMSTRLHPLTLSKVKVGRSFITVNADQRIHGADFMPGLPWIISPLLGFAPELQAGSGFFDALSGVSELDLPLRVRMQALSKATIEAETQRLWDRWKAPPYLLAVGSRAFDRSPYGVMDMLWNGPELVQPPATARGGLNGFAISTTMLHPQDQAIANELLLVTGPNTSGLLDSYPAAIPYPLSRLIGRSPGLPVAQWLWFQWNLEEARASMRLLSGWQVCMQPAVATVDVRTDNHSPFVGPVFYDNFPLYRPWTRPTKHQRLEIGSAIPLPELEELPVQIVPRDTGATLRFVIPIGFRCAR